MAIAVLNNPAMPVFKRHMVWIVVAVVLCHGLLLLIGRYGWPSLKPPKSEITIELGSPMPLHIKGSLDTAGDSSSDAEGSSDSKSGASPSASKSTQQDELATQRAREASEAAPSAKAPTNPEERKAESVPAETTPTQAAPAVDVPPSVDADYKAAFLNNPKPPYPPLVFKMRIEGTVMLKALVLPDGTCGEVLLARSSGNDLLDKSALATVAQWKFTPAKAQGKETSQWVGIPITFSLKHR
jgi:TonB family protein